MRNLSQMLVAAAATGLLAFGAPAHAAEKTADATKPGKAAAHEALAEKADLPATPPELPRATAGPPNRSASGAADEKKGEAAKRAHAHAEARAADDARSAHLEAANRAAQASVAAAARSANADSHAAAGQARAAAAKANAREHGQGHP